MAAISYVVESIDAHILGIVPLLVILYVSRYTLFHPLRDYPGPFLARLTDFYGGFLSLRQNLHLKVVENFKTYGPVYRQGPNKLVFNSAAAVHDILLSTRVSKGSAYDNGRLTAGHPHIVGTTDKQLHRKKRRIIAPILNERSMRIFEPSMLGRINQMLQNLASSSKSGLVVNMSDICLYLASDIVGLLAFGYSFNNLTEETNRFLPHRLADIVGRVNTIKQFSWLKIPQLISLTLQMQEMKKFRHLIKTMVAERQAKDQDALHDFYSAAAKEIEISGEFFQGHFWPEAASFLIAGGLTTATAMSGVFFYLSRYPDCYARLAEEIRSTFSNADEIVTSPRLSGCKYLRACIEEALRCTSPVTGMLWRVQDPNDTTSTPFVIDGHVIPRGVEFGINLYCIMHNPDIFPNPYLFNPDRWLEAADENAEETAARELMRQCLIPFSVGERGCAGKPMAWAEMNITIARTLWYFDFDKAPGDLGKLGEKFHLKLGGSSGETIPGYAIMDGFAAVHDGPNLVFKVRDSTAKELEAL